MTTPFQDWLTAKPCTGNPQRRTKVGALNICSTRTLNGDIIAANNIKPSICFPIFRVLKLLYNNLKTLEGIPRFSRGVPQRHIIRLFILNFIKKK
jgi:hypothetical protein